MGIHDDQLLLVEDRIVALQNEALIERRSHLDKVGSQVESKGVEVEESQENIPEPHFRQPPPLLELLQERHYHIDKADALQSSLLRVGQSVPLQNLPGKEVKRSKHGELEEVLLDFLVPREMQVVLEVNKDYFHIKALGVFVESKLNDGQILLHLQTDTTHSGEALKFFVETLYVLHELALLRLVKLFLLVGYFQIYV